MNNCDIKYSPFQTILFGDFTEEELKITESNHLKWNHHSTTVTNPTPCYSTIHQYPKTLNVTVSNPGESLDSTFSSVSALDQTSIWFVFGSFTDKECLDIQIIKTHSRSITLNSSPPRRRCFRCGYNSHTIENCVATRHRTGEYIGYSPRFDLHHVNSNFPFPHYPSSPSSSGTSTFIPELSNVLTFNISDLREWMLHDYEYKLNEYLDSLKTSASVSAEQRFQVQVEDQKIGEYLYLDYLTTNLLFEKQTSNYFQNYTR